jgi:hypothetical protein
MVSPLWAAAAAARIVAYCLAGPTVRMRPAAVGHAIGGGGAGDGAGGGGAGVGVGLGDGDGVGAGVGAALPVVDGSDEPPQAATAREKNSATADDWAMRRDVCTRITGGASRRRAWTLQQPERYPTEPCFESPHRVNPYGPARPFHSAVKKPFIRSTKLFSCGECFCPPAFSKPSNSRSSFFCFSVSRTGVSTVTWQYKSPG